MNSNATRSVDLDRADPATPWLHSCYENLGANRWSARGERENGKTMETRTVDLRPKRLQIDFLRYEAPDRGVPRQPEKVTRDAMVAERIVVRTGLVGADAMLRCVVDNDGRIAIRVVRGVEGRGDRQPGDYCNERLGECSAPPRRPSFHRHRLFRLSAAPLAVKQPGS